jgi:hypothetical protein
MSVVNNVSRNLGVQISIWDLGFSPQGYVCRSGVAGWYDNSILNFKRNHYTFSTEAVIIFTFPLTVYKGPNISTYLLTIVICCFVSSGHPNGYESVSHWSLIYFSLMINNVTSFPKIMDHLWICLEEMSI